MNIKEKIIQIVPDAQFSEQEILIATVPAEHFHTLAERLHSDEDMQFDFLQCMTGMDWGESLGVICHLVSTVHGHRVAIKTMTGDRENPELPTISDIWKAAELNEREIYDFFGIRFINHPDMRRLYLRSDWVGYPLRKDYNSDESINPLRMTNEETIDTTETLHLTSDGKIESEENVIFDEKEYVINVGPQHPATHGVLRFRVSLAGETVKKIDVNCGYIHRGIEKLCEGLTYPQTLAFTDRLDYLAAHQNRHALCMCIEKGMGIEVPERVQYIRTIMDELQRIDSHLLFFSCLCMDLGALTAFFYGFRDREKILDIFEETCGGRLILNYNTIGGVQDDIHPNFVKRVKDFIAYLPPVLEEYHSLFTGNIIAQQRLKGIGVLSREDAISFGVTGASGRASGWANDVRKRTPYGVYDKVDFKEIVYTEGDSFARYMVRMDEILESIHIIEQLIDNIPEGPFQVKTKPIIRIPEGSYYASTEASRGEFGVYIESQGEKSPYRMKFRSTGLPLVSVVDTIASGGKIADLIAIGATLDYVVPDIDR
ncbi:MAG: NADH-quinone oxidoreductase subunit D [Bacteroidales bacterium]|nr:NADH-quinone oxidoreductase subunit D [Bacteroidales bacterium]